jgi:hypothetical protein
VTFSKLSNLGATSLLYIKAVDRPVSPAVGLKENNFAASIVDQLTAATSRFHLEQLVLDRGISSRSGPKGNYIAQSEVWRKAPEERVA